MYKFPVICSFICYLFVMYAIAIAKSEDYEEPSILQAKNVVPEKLYKSDLYEIENEVMTHGYTNTYRITSEYGNFTAHGNEMLRERLHEIRAIDELEKIKKSEKFQEGLKNSAKMPFSFIKNLVTHPVDTISGVPKGLWRYGSRIGEMATGEKSEYEDGVAKELILFSGQKRKLAYDLYVDVYSSNKVLQEKLNSVSWASYSGGVAVTAALRPLGPIRFTKTAQSLNVLIRDNSPEDLHKINRKILRNLDVPEEIIEDFQENIWISPRHETTIVHSLEYQGLKDGVSDFIRLISTAESEEDAYFFQNITQLIEHYISNVVESETSIVIHDNFALLRVRKHFVFPMLVDNGYWSEFGAHLINKFERDIRSQYGEDVQILLWISGEVSDRAKKELSERKIILMQNAYTAVGKDI